MLSVTRLRTVVAAVLLCVPSLACEVVAPSGGSKLISAGETRTGGVGPWAQETVTVKLAANQAVGLEISSPLGVLVQVFSPGEHVAIRQVRSERDSVEATVAQAPPGGGTLQIHVLNTGGGEANPYILRTYLIDARPETVSPALQVGQVVQTESIGNGSDLDVFIISGKPGDVYTARIRLPTGSPVDAYVKFLRNERPWRFIDIAAGSGMTESATWLLTLGATPDTLFILGMRPRSEDPVSAVIPYQVEIYKVDPAPEHNPVRLSFTSPTTEGFERSGDIDEFEIQVQAGDILWLDSPIRFADTEIHADRTAPDGTVSNLYWILTADFEGQGHTGVMTFPQAGLYRLRLFANHVIPDAQMYTLTPQRAAAVK